MFIDKCTEEEKLAFHKVLTCLALDACKEHHTDNFEAGSSAYMIMDSAYMIMDDGSEKKYKFRYNVQILSIEQCEK